MTKKQFTKDSYYIKYTGVNKDETVIALFYEHKVVHDLTVESDELFGKPIIGRGFKYCIYARAINCTKQELINTLYDFIKGIIDETPYYIQLVIAQDDTQRFRVPLNGNSLTKLINYNLVNAE